MFSLPNLAYAYDALEPTMSAKTLHFHHDKHHAAYVKALNDLAEELIARGLDKSSPEAQEVMRYIAHSVPHFGVGTAAQMRETLDAGLQAAANLREAGLTSAELALRKDVEVANAIMRPS